MSCDYILPYALIEAKKRYNYDCSLSFSTCYRSITFFIISPVSCRTLCFVTTFISLNFLKSIHICLFKGFFFLCKIALNRTGEDFNKIDKVLLQRHDVNVGYYFKIFIQIIEIVY